MFEPLLGTKHLSKHFSSSPAVDDVSIDVNSGEVVGLVGETGSGRSMLCMLLSGRYRADSGEIRFGGKRLSWPFNARALGIETIYKNPELIDEMDVTSNIFLGNELGLPGLPNKKKMEHEAKQILSNLDLEIESLDEKAAYLLSDQRQLITIARVLTTSPRMVLIDMPDPLLGFHHQSKLLDLIGKWQRQGAAVLFNSNNLDHLFAVTDRILVMHQGRLVADERTDNTSREEVVASMVGSTDQRQITPVIWALESYHRARERAEMLHKRQLLFEQELSNDDSSRIQFLQQWSKQLDALDHLNRALQDAQRRLLTEREEERKLIAREIHDLIIQELVGLNYEIDELKSDPSTSMQVQEKLAEIREEVGDLVDDLRHICGTLRPPTIDSLGLGTALQSFVHDWENRTNINVHLELGLTVGRLPEEIELSIFRMIQEGLNNIRKHAEATHVEINLKETSPRTLLVSITDNGRGLPGDFDLSMLASNGHYGLLGISERVALLGGRLKIQNQQGEPGLSIQAEIPHPRRK